MKGIGPEESTMIIMIAMKMASLKMLEFSVKDWYFFLKMILHVFSFSPIPNAIRF